MCLFSHFNCVKFSYQSFLEVNCYCWVQTLRRQNVHLLWTSINSLVVELDSHELFLIIQWVPLIQGLMNSVNARRKYNVLFKTWKSPKLKSGCFHPTMMKYREIILETSPIGAVQLLCLKDISHPAGEGNGNRHTLCDKLVCQTESLRQSHLLTCLSCLCVCPVGTSVMQVTATDADDPTYGNSARLVYSILQGQPYFSVEPQTGETETDPYLILQPSAPLIK